jgi:protein phosphatase
MLISTTVCDQGLVRERNEDSVIGNNKLGLWVVADGVGGNAHGDIASQLVVQTIERRIRQGKSLGDSVADAHNAILDAIEGQPDLDGMATTVVASLFHGHQFELAWVGDSRAYLLDQEGISQLSSDHNLANELFQQGEIAEDEIQSHPGQHELTQAMGQMNLPTIPKVLGELHQGDVLLLCTDGLSGPLAENEIYNIVVSSESLEKAGEVLLEKVIEAGAPDNIAFSLVQFQEDVKQIQASDFNAKPQRSSAPLNPPEMEGSFRRPLDKRAYRQHLKGRKMLMALILFAIAFLIFFI